MISIQKGLVVKYTDVYNSEMHPKKRKKKKTEGWIDIYVTNGIKYYYKI